MHATTNSRQNDATSRQSKDELQAIQDLLGQDFCEIARIFLLDTQQRLSALQAATTAADRASIEKIAHVLCGSSASIGATDLAQHCRHLEIAAKQGRLEQKEAQLRTICNEYARIETKLVDMIQPD